MSNTHLSTRNSQKELDSCPHIDQTSYALTIYMKTENEKWEKKFSASYRCSFFECDRYIVIYLEFLWMVSLAVVLAFIRHCSKHGALM